MSHENCIRSNDWTLSVDSKVGTVFDFNFKNEVSLTSRGTNIGILNELQGINKYTRLHKKEKIDWYAFDSETFLPFGAEPLIKRKIEQAGNHIRITTDARFSSSFSLDKLEVDSLEISGDLEKIVYLVESQETLEVKELSSEKIESTFSFEELPILILFKFKNNKILEIGSGFDIWRWNISRRFSCSYSFSIEKLSYNKFLFKRCPLKFSEETELKRFDFRFTWYFAWLDDSKVVANNDQKIEESKLLDVKNGEVAGVSEDISSYRIGISSLSQTMLTSSKKNICFASGASENMLKKLIRRASNMVSNQYETISIGRFTPEICKNSQHLERNKNEQFSHWTLWHMMLFWEWANIFASQFNKKLNLQISLDEKLGNIPSIIGMSKK